MLDVAVLALLGVGWAWMYVRAALVPGSSSYGATLYLILASGLVLGRWLSRLGLLVAPVGVLAIAAALWIGDPQGFISSAPKSYPFGYSNAKGAFLVEATAASVMVGVAAARQRVKEVALLSAALFVVLCFVIDVIAAGAMALVILMGAISLPRWRTPRRVVSTAAMLFGAALLTTLIVGSSYQPDQAPAQFKSVLNATISQRRPMLWHEGIVTMVEHPLTGVGPGRFEETNPVALSDEDIRWIPNTFLTHGAEAGVPGFLILTSVFIVGFARLYVQKGDSKMAALGSAALAGIGIYACMDYVLQFPLVPAGASILVGAATSKNAQQHNGAPKGDLG